MTSGDIPTTAAPIQRVFDGAALGWGESLRWDDQRGRLYFVDCSARRLLWAEEAALHGAAEFPSGVIDLAGTPTGLVLTDGAQLVVCLDDGLYAVDPDSGAVDQLSPYPAGMHGRANDAHPDGHGNLLTGTLNLAPGSPGALWQYSTAQGWRLLKEGWGNTNGPTVLDAEGQPTLAVADTIAGRVAFFPYDPDRAALGPEPAAADFSGLGGYPDGAAATADGRIVSCLVGRGALAVVSAAGGVEALIEVPPTNPSDISFGGPDFARVFVVSIDVDLGAGVGDCAGRLLELELGMTGAPEPRFALS